MFAEPHELTTRVHNDNRTALEMMGTHATSGHGRENRHLWCTHTLASLVTSQLIRPEDSRVDSVLGGP